MTPTNSNFFCIKRNKEITTEECGDCFKKENSGSSNHEHCMNRNLKIIKNKEEEK